MDKNKYSQLMTRLDAEELRLFDNHPVPNLAGIPRSAGFLIHPEMDVSSITEDNIPLVHAMLHMFYQNRSGRGLSRESIIDLHSRLKERINNHQDFDGLDKNELY